MRANHFYAVLATVGIAGAIGPCRASSSAPANKTSTTAEMRAAADKIDPTKEDYDRHVGCAAIAAAAVADSQMLSSPSEKEKMDASTVLKVTRDKALASGKSLGRAPDDVAKAIEQHKAGILKKLRQAEGPAAEKEKKDLGHVLIECAIVEKLGR